MLTSLGAQQKQTNRLQSNYLIQSPTSPSSFFAAKDTVETIPELGGLIVRDLRYTTTSNLSGRLKLTKELDHQSETPAIRFSQSSDASGLKKWHEYAVERSCNRYRETKSTMDFCEFPTG